MLGFKDIVGHEDTIAHMQGAIRNGKVSHAYLIQGPEGSGKRLIASTFAAALECEQGGEEPCGNCHSCHQMESRNHPDVVYVTHEKPNTIGVDDVRDQIVATSIIRPYNGKYKIYIVPEAEKMNVQAQNALLKTLEEPPEYVVILLLTTNADLMLDTIRSRCLGLDLRPVRDELVTKYLMEKAEIPDYQAQLCAAFAQGSIGKAIALATSERFNEIRMFALRLVRKAKESDIADLNEQVKSVAEYKLEINDFLDILAVWYRDVLYFKATMEADGLVFRDQLALIREASKTSSYEGIETILKAIETAKTRLNANVSFDLAMELLFLTIKEN